MEYTEGSCCNNLSDPWELRNIKYINKINNNLECTRGYSVVFLLRVNLLF